MKKQGKPALGPCRCGCGQRATVRKHMLAASCYARCRVWSNVKTPEERAAYMGTLVNRHRCLDMVQGKEITIGTSPFNWKASSVAHMLAAPNMRRQRGGVR
jgi:hypothetical protein